MPISTDDFRFGETIAAAGRSAAYDEAHPHQFEGLAPRHATSMVRSVFVPMRDGVRLSTDFHLPLGAAGPLPVILSRTPYSKRESLLALRTVFAEQGFVHAIQDVRGRYESEGEFTACSAADRSDGYDTVTWIADQPWCNGAVGSIGSSYVGETAGKLAAGRHPNHRANVMLFDGAYAGGRIKNGAFLQDGATLLRALFLWFRDYVPKYSYGPPPGMDRERWFASAFADLYATQPVRLPEVDLDRHLETLPVADLLDSIGAAPSEFAEMMRRAANPADPYWDAQGFLSETDQFDVPTLHVTGPQERGGSGPDNFNLFRRNSLSARARDNQVLIFSPCPHSGFNSGGEAQTIWGARDFGDTRFPYYRTFVEWFGRWLRDDHNGVEDWPKVQIFVAGANVWRRADQWPPADVQTVSLYLDSGGRAASDPSDGTLTVEPPEFEREPDRFLYRPSDPTPSEPPSTGLDLLGGGYADRTPLEARGDMAVYTSEVLEEPLEVSGRVKVVLYVASSAPDTDFVATLMEVGPDGRAINVTHGLARARYREALDRPVWMERGKVYRVEIDLWHAAITFRPGRRVRLHVASSHFPYYERNLNTGGDYFVETAWIDAENAIHHSDRYPSALVLPVRREPRL